MSSKEEESLPHSLDVVSSVVPRHDIMQWPVVVPVQDFSYIALILQIKDFLPTFFRCFVADQWRVEELFSLMIVCKEWHTEISTVLVDLQWLMPMRTRGQLFVDEIPLLVESIVSGEWDKHPYATKVGNVEQFYGKMRANMFDEETMKVALVALGDIVNSELCTKHAQRAVRMVEAVMKMHRNSVPMQICGYKAISSIAEKSFNVPLLISDKGVQLILSAMRKQNAEKDEDSARDAFGIFLLQWLAKPLSGTFGVMIEAGLVPLVLALMTRTHHANNERHLQGGALKILLRVASNESYRRALCAADVVPLVLAAMTSFGFDEFLQRDGAQILGHLTRTSTTRDALPTGLIECVVRAMKQFPFQLEVNKACMWALQCFLLNRHNVPAVVAVDGAQIIMQSMSTHSGHARVLECGFLVLSCLSTHDASRVYIQDHKQRHGGVLAMALQAVREQTRNRNFQAVGHAIGALASFVEDYPHMHAAFRASGGVREMSMACGLRGLTPKNRAVAQRILGVCGVLLARLAADAAPL